MCIYCKKNYIITPAFLLFAKCVSVTLADDSYFIIIIIMSTLVYKASSPLFTLVVAFIISYDDDAFMCKFECISLCHDAMTFRLLLLRCYTSGMHLYCYKNMLPRCVKYSTAIIVPLMLNIPSFAGLVNIILRKQI